MSTLWPLVPKFVPQTRATGTDPELVRETDESSGAKYEKDFVRTPLCSETETDDASSSEIPGAILHNTEVSET
jgi:hypothetical protein